MNTPRRKKNSSKVNLILSTVFHTVIIVALFYFAAREGMLGKQLKKIAVQMAPKEKPPEKPKEPEKPPEPPKETPKEEPKMAQPKTVEAPKVARAAAPPAAAPAAAPPAAALPAFSFSDGAKIVQDSSDPTVIYKGLVEWALRAKWNRPENMNDESYVAEVEVAIDPTGKLVASDWKKGSGDAKWDDSVRRALAATKAFTRPPPKGFPERVLVRFDVQQETETIIQ